MPMTNAEPKTTSSGECETIGQGKGIFHFFRRIWFYLLVIRHGGKGNIIQMFSKHRKLSLEDVPKPVHGQTVVITGGARGIGAAILKQCLQLDMHVIIGCRNPTAGQGTVDTIRSYGVHSGSAQVLPLDLNSLFSVRQFAETLLNKSIPIHCLINNAGVMFSPFQITPDGFERQFQSNYLSHFLLTILLQPALNLGGKLDYPSRVVNVSSVAHYGGRLDFDNIDLKKNYSPHLSYMCTKLMQVISTVDLNRKFVKENVNVRVYSVHPGVVKTELYENVRAVRLFGKLLNFMFLTPEEGADCVMYAAVSPDVNPDGGCYYINCKEQPVNLLALDPTLQQKLYGVSMELCRRNAWSPTEGDP